MRSLPGKTCTKNSIAKLVSELSFQVFRLLKPWNEYKAAD